MNEKLYGILRKTDVNKHRLYIHYDFVRINPTKNIELIIKQYNSLLKFCDEFDEDNRWNICLVGYKSGGSGIESGYYIKEILTEKQIEKYSILL